MNNRIRPRSLAKALAGLPYMRWRQSNFRCTGMVPLSGQHEWYRSFLIIRKMWGTHRQADFAEPPIDLFRKLILKLPKKSTKRATLAPYWYDLKTAIEECWMQTHDSDAIPFVIAANFARNRTRMKSRAESVLADEESLI